MPDPGVREARRLGDFLRREHGRIIARWESDVRRLRPAEYLSQPVLLDHMPDFLEQLADFASDAREHHDATPPQEFPVIHALERLDLGYDLAEVVAEYALLRECIAALAQGEGSPALSSAEMPRLHKAIDLAIGASVVRYAQARERTLKALDRISTAALDVREAPPVFLRKTLDALLQTTPAIDSASLLLVEDGELRVKAAAGFALGPDEAPGLKRGQCLAGAIWQAGTPMTTRDAETDPRVSSETIRRRGTHALYGAPLVLGDEVIGVLVIGSCSTFEFSHEDILLVRTAVSRMALLVAQAQKEDAIRRQTALYESVVSALGDVGEGFGIVDQERLTLVNDAFCRIAGRTAEELYALPSMLEVIAPEQRESLRARLGESATGGIESVFHCKDGRRVEVELGIKRKATGRIVVVVHDVSERKRHERQLALERARLQTMLRVLPVGLVLAEAPDGRITMANAEAERIWGRIDYIASYAGYSGFWPDGRPVGPEEWPLARAIFRGETTPAEEIRVVSSEGATRTVEHRAAPIRDDEGGVVAAVVTLVDVTERKRTEEELRGALAFRDQILHILAHDLRQPLSVISASAQLLRRQQGDAKAITRTLNSVDRMDRLIRDLLDYARVKRGTGIPVSRKPADLREVLRPVVASFEMVHPDRRFEVSAAGDCSGEFDADRIQQAFQNLIGNAVSYSPKGTPVAIALRCGDGIVACSVHNFGEPIPPAQLGMVFEPFRRGSAAGNATGLGLGLFIVGQIAAAHGGGATVTSDAAAGTTFTLHLPKAAQAR